MPPPHGGTLGDRPGGMGGRLLFSMFKYCKMNQPLFNRGKKEKENKLIIMYIASLIFQYHCFIRTTLVNIWFAFTSMENGIMT